MRKSLLAIAAAGLVLTLASPPWSATSGASPPLPPPPAAIGKCKVDPARREECTAKWRQCLVTAHKGGDPCPAEWRACCTARHTIDHPPEGLHPS